MCDVRRDLPNKKMEKLKDDFMQNLFNQMDKFNERRVIRTEFESWFIIKMPKMNAHDRMKCLGMLHYNIGTDPFISFMLLDTLGEGLLDLDRAADYVMDNIQLNSKILIDIPKD